MCISVASQREAPETTHVQQAHDVAVVRAVDRFKDHAKEVHDGESSGEGPVEHPTLPEAGDEVLEQDLSWVVCAVVVNDGPPVADTRGGHGGHGRHGWEAQDVGELAPYVFIVRDETFQ